jgi:hypothetical protein
MCKNLDHSQNPGECSPICSGFYKRVERAIASCFTVVNTHNRVAEQLFMLSLQVHLSLYEKHLMGECSNPCHNICSWTC